MYKKDLQFYCLFLAILGSERVKAVRRTLMKLTQERAQLALCLFLALLVQCIILSSRVGSLQSLFVLEFV